MILGRLNSAEPPPELVGHPIWREALDWIARLPASPTQGIHELRGREMFANVHGYPTRPRTECRYEAHRIYVDLQYCISGGEKIEWHPLGELSPRDAYDPVKDVRHYEAPPVPERLLAMTAGCYAIFFPEDGHMPKLADGVHPGVEKLVVKIDRRLLV